MRKNNALILIQGKDIAASRYRILQYVSYLEEHGTSCHVREFPNSIREYVSLYSILPRYLNVFVQRKRFHYPFLPLFRKRAKRIVYDLDDAVMYKNSLAGSPYSKTREMRFRNMVKASDVIIAGNSFLKEKAQVYNKNIEVIPSSIPVGKYELKDHSVLKERVTIGWIGDHGSIHYLERFKNVWDEIGRKYPGKVELKIICDTFFDCESIPVRKVHWSSDSEVKELQDIDIGVMPLLDDLWSWGKCGLKILQYYGVGIPSVCTPVGVNRDIVSHGENGFWAMSIQEWIDNLSILIEDAALRKKMGLDGRHALEKGFTMEANASRILSILNPC
jgi:glycosyltransferase involved in cell wall biosynthesis